MNLFIVRAELSVENGAALGQIARPSSPEQDVVNRLTRLSLIAGDIGVLGFT